MKKIVSVFTIITLVLTASCLFAQQVTISGSVIDAKTAEPLAGANVLVVGELVGGATNADGNFSFSMDIIVEIVLNVGYMGYKKQHLIVKPGDNTTGLVFELEADVIGLEKVVVTALGITQEQKAIGYSQQSIDASELTEVAETNIVSNLSGKVAGVQIMSSSGVIGASARIQVRGISTFTGDNQPLFVVDGVPISNQYTSSGSYGGVVDFGNASADINSNDIKSINILKGANAAALYGSRALNGVIEITTKTGKGAGMMMKKGLGISYSNHTTFRTYYPLVDFQDKYGQGGGMDFSYYDGNYGGINDGTDESWGPPLDGYRSDEYQTLYGTHDHIQIQGAGQPLLIKQFNSPFADGTIDPALGSWGRTPTPWVSRPDNVKNFFETGMSQEHNISVYGGNVGSNFRLSLTHQDDKGVLYNTDQTRNSIYMSGNIMVDKKLTISAVANYVQLNNDNLTGNGYDGGNPMQQFTGWFGRQVDLSYLKDNVKFADGTPKRWNYAYHDNPYWILGENLNSRFRERIFGNISLDYKFTDWLMLTARGGTDWFVENRKYVKAMYSNDYPDGNFSDNTDIRKETNFDVFLKADRDLTDDINVKAMVGANYRSNFYKWQQTAVSGLIVPDLYAVSNSAETPTTNTTLRESRHNSVYGRLSVGYQDFAFLDFTGRNDWASTLPEENRSYFYPSVTGSFLFTEFFEIDPTDLFGKVRASWAKVGNSTGPYRLTGSYGAGQPFMGYPVLGYTNQMPNNTLLPEEKTSIEVGTDLKFMNNRFGLSFTYYKENTVNQIIGIDVSSSTGFGTKLINAGELENKGVEISLNATPIEKNKFRWDIDINWAKNTNEVIELYGDLEALSLFGGAWGGLQFLARPGEPWGQIVGNKTYTHKGKPVVRTSGFYAGGLQPEAGTAEVLGNVIPDWTGGIRNTFKYGNFSLSALVDASWGGDLFSVTTMFGQYAGILEESVSGFDHDYGDWTLKAAPVTGNDIRKDGVLVDGYVEQADGSFIENTIVADGYAFALTTGWPGLGGHSPNIFDATWVKLRSVTLSYRIPRKYVAKVGLQGATIGLEGRNLFILYKKVPHIDPEAVGFTAGINQGVEQNQLPATRMFGMSLKLDL